MAKVITIKGQQLIDVKKAESEKLSIDSVVLAYNPDQNLHDNISTEFGLPSEAQIVYRSTELKAAAVDDNAIVFTLDMDASVGNFVFNTLYLMSGETVVLINSLPEMIKCKQDLTRGAMGDVMKRPVVLRTDGIKALCQLETVYTKPDNHALFESRGELRSGDVLMHGSQSPRRMTFELNGTLLEDGVLEFEDLAYSGSTFVEHKGLDLKLSDFRGEFIRGWDHGRGVDPTAGRALGTWQEDAIRNITGAMYSGGTSQFDSVTGVFNGTGRVQRVKGEHDYSGPNSVYFDTSKVVPTSTENRPRNIAAMYCIVF